MRNIFNISILLFLASPIYGYAATCVLKNEDTQVSGIEHLLPEATNIVAVNKCNDGIVVVYDALQNIGQDLFLSNVYVITGFNSEVEVNKRYSLCFEQEPNFDSCIDIGLDKKDSPPQSLMISIGALKLEISRPDKTDLLRSRFSFWKRNFDKSVSSFLEEIEKNQKGIHLGAIVKERIDNRDIYLIEIQTGSKSWTVNGLLQNNTLEFLSVGRNI
ncbi:hypothetical protein [Glaciecola sp. KUL10]|uniref:hypothetical protein n=1 Tax=Glaciecola sp. (strain KUL10) TaxID=2161813 RepID=UPI000D789D2F|nr:hypothetical protein [Glaciecola sp. KUL10]GBL06322.1 hypothetical protein KUL10_36620 [Glaciecola sp. KUL10]